MVISDENQLIELMGKVFPGYENLKVDSVTPSITGEDQQPLISFMIVCNEEAAVDFVQTDEISAEVHACVEENRSGGKDLNLRFDFTFELFSLQFFTVIESSNEQQSHFVNVLKVVDFFIIWLVDQEKNLLKILQVKWDKESQKEMLNDLA